MLVCDHCVETYGLRTAEGRSIQYSNITAMATGLQSKEEGDSVWKQWGQCQSQCFVNGVECFAAEGRFGGYVIQVRKDNIQ